MDTKFYQKLAEAHRAEILAAEQWIWKHPETGFKEWETSAYLAAAFEQAGYALTKAGDIPGFYTDLDTGRPGPKVLVMAELDGLVLPNHFAAVNGNAHACGHHAQCAALLGLALALREPGALDGLSGSVRLMAVPAEELIEIEFRDELRRKGTIRYLGGKTEFIARGYLDGVDLAFLFHTGTQDYGFDCHRGGNGCVAKTARYKGVAAHAGGQPHEGVNALYAASLGLQAVNAIREALRDDDHIRIHPILTAGGSCVNIIPDEAMLESYVRGASIPAILEANRKVNRALAAGALALGATVTVHDRPGYAPQFNDPTLSRAACAVMAELLGEDEVRHTDVWSCGCTDMGDVGCLMPVLHPHIGGAAGRAHGEDFRITDPERACVQSAAGQLALLARLLEHDAALAKETVAAYQPLYPSKEAYFALLDSILQDKDLVRYQKTGTAEVL